jgi:hypothetical protein
MEAYIHTGLGDEARKNEKEAWNNKTHPTGKTKASFKGHG